MSEILSREQVKELLEFGKDMGSFDIRMLAHDAALRARLEAVTQEYDAVKLHLQANQDALGLTGIESRPQVMYIMDLKQQLAAVTQERDRLVAWLKHLRTDECDDGTHYSGSLRLCDIDLCCDLALSGDPAPQKEPTEQLTSYQLSVTCTTALEAQRIETYNAVKREHYAKQMITTQESIIENLGRERDRYKALLEGKP